MWDKMKRAMVESARKMCGSVRIVGGNPKSVWWNYQVKAAVKRKEDAWWNDQVKAAVRRKEDAWKAVLGAR